MNIPIETEYNTLRNEILNEMGLQTNLRIAMCTMAVAILSFAIERESSILCLVVFVVLIPFRLLIHSKQFGILRISAYLIVRFENRYSNLIWEKTVSKMIKNTHSKNTIRNRLVGDGGYCVATIFGILAAIFYLSYLESYNFLTISAIGLCLLITIFLDFVFDNQKIRQDYMDEFKGIL